MRLSMPTSTGARSAWRCGRPIAVGLERAPHIAGAAFDAYEAALDCEEGAANVYAGLIQRVAHLVETDLTRQLVQARER